jgi:hypothetical protein
VPAALWIGAAFAGVLLIGAAVFLLSRDEDRPRADGTPAVIAAPTRSPALDQRLARRDRAVDTTEYTRVLDSLQSKLHQSGEQLALCAEEGVAEMSRRNAQITVLEMLKRMDGATTPQPADLPAEYRLSCREVVRVVIGISGQ